MFESKTTKAESHSTPAVAKTSAFFQPSLKSGIPGDKYEVEADQVADRVVADSKSKNGIEIPFFAPNNLVQNRIQLQEEEELQTKSEDDNHNENDVVQDSNNVVPDALQSKSETIQPIIQAQNSEEQIQEQELEEDEIAEAQGLVQKLEDFPEEENGNVLQANGETNYVSSIEPSLIQSKGGGSSLPQNTKSEMESGIGADFSSVKVHTGSNAVQMSESIGAQAFTHGNDIYFNEGKYSPDSDSGKHLLAHELTHTVQQGASVQSKMIQKVEGDPQAVNPDDILKKFYLPAVKARHLSIYQSWASQGKLKRFQGYSRGNPNQVRLWKNHYWETMQNTERIGLHENFSGLKRVRTPGDQEFRGRRRTLLKKLSVPNWDNQGALQEHALEVDHIVELQAGGWPNSTSPNEIENMELLDKSSNATAGSKTKSNIVKIVRNYLEARGDANTQADAENYMASNTVNFEQVELGQGDFAGSAIESKFWSGAEIEQGVHLAYVEDLGNIGEPGTPTEFALMTPDDGFLMQLFTHTENVLSIPVAEDSPESKAIAGLSISNVSLNTGYDATAADTAIGTITATWNLPDKFNAPEGPFQVSIKKSIGQYAGKIQNLPRIGLDFQDMSPINFTGDYGINEDGIFAEGRLTPSMSFLQGAAIVVGIRGEEVYFNAEYSPSNLNLPVPGLTIDASTLWVGYSNIDGFGVGGNIEFQLSSIGAGTIEAGYTQEEGFYIRGEITFDESLFGRTQASVRMAYESSLWSIGGTLVIPENQVQGIKQATINADYSEESGFTATGEAELDIPGIERGTMTVNYSDEGFLIQGNFDLSSDIPGIQSGNVEARVAKEEGAENYDIMVSGTAQPDIPGIDTSLTITYENGAITIEGSASYERGMLSGNVNVGATNRAIGEDGEPTGEPGDTMRVYGGGDLTLQLTPWLEATAGVQFLPNGEMEVTGRIALPSAVDVFDRREFRRNLFTVPTIEIPIFAIPLGPRSIGLVAQISGGLDFAAGFGPGQLRDVYAEVTYNPDREDETTISGHGEFAIPADAGLTLRGDLGLGVSIGIASLSGGIELAGTLGLEGEAAAEVDLSWSPPTGIVLDAQGRIMVNPKFTFDVNAFARASLGIGWFSISETWRHNLVSFSWGPDIQFGVIFPVHYQEDQPFDISFDDIEVVYPDLDVVDMAKGLARDIKDDIFD